jgi:hypothetical protein
MVALSAGGDPSPPTSFPPDIESFRSSWPQLQNQISPPPSKFVKKLDKIPKVPVHASLSINLVLRFATEWYCREVYRDLAIPKRSLQFGSIKAGNPS